MAYKLIWQMIQKKGGGNPSFVSRQSGKKNRILHGYHPFIITGFLQTEFGSIFFNPKEKTAHEYP
jgi:hypothetical protein